MLGVLAAALVAALLLARPWDDTIPVMRASTAPETERSVSVDFAVVTDPSTDWAALDRHLDTVGADGVDLNAGRVEFTAFDWAAHPEAAAEPGTDHIARAARSLHEHSDGTTRQFGLIVDAYVPEWIKADPSIAGISADGRRSRYQASASQLTSGPVGDRLVEYVAAVGERYDPSRISITELFLGEYTFGADDLALYREMAGADDWPRDADGTVDEDSTELEAWRAEVLAGLLGRMRDALDEVRDGAGSQIQLAVDVRPGWDGPPERSTADGPALEILLGSADRLVVWAYVGTDDGEEERDAQDVSTLTGRLEDDGVDMSRLTVSVGLWAGPTDASPPQSISPEKMAEAVEAAASHGVDDVNVTPASLLTDAHWAALGEVWGAGGSSTPAALSVPPVG